MSLGLRAAAFAYLAWVIGIAALVVWKILIRGPTQ
jgi:hypothetical protein